MEAQRELLVRQARTITQREAERQEPIFALLTGSAAWGAVSSRSDIDIIFISRQSDFVSYRYYMPGLTDVTIRTEVGRIPLAYLEKILASGYADDISTGVREQIRNARVLLGDQQRAQEMIAGFAALKPRKKLLGEYLFLAGEALAKTRQALAEPSATKAVLWMDALSKNIWRLVLVADHQIGVQKDKHEIRAARAELDERKFADYQVSRRVAGIDKQSALTMLRAAQAVISKVLNLAGISSSIVGEIEE
ncbi:MAG: hypothetical protein V1694_08485 [Candidatus Eisenbacteria bacterium]